MQKTNGTTRETTKGTTEHVTPDPATDSKVTRKPSALKGRLARDHGLNFF